MMHLHILSANYHLPSMCACKGKIVHHKCFCRLQDKVPKLTYIWIVSHTHVIESQTYYHLVVPVKHEHKKLVQ